ncbi:aspartyl protease APCB1 [Coffea eugenioides]|uniref:aspartyl protease APCB1 n=1 Tax=Coffea eugenioides TaxID=49369 RepID=UPI000F604F9B|nr:aspartyl protease APCB1 [Coffea eugenioides]
MEENEESPRLKGIVIITLPPADNPSLGKTITAFTLTDESQFQPPSNHHQNQIEPPSQPSQSQEDSQSTHAQIPFSLKRFLFYIPIPLFGLVFMSLIALSYWVSFSQETLYELREIDDDQKSNTIIFPLFPKGGIGGSLQGEFEIKLGRFVGSNSKIGKIRLSDGLSQRKSLKSMIAESKIDSTAVLPLKGNIYPDGLYYTYVLVGTPPRPYFLDMDTGSDLTWIQCDAPCTSCAKGAHPFYKPAANTIIRSDDSYCAEVQINQRTNCATCHQCDYEIEYADHSSSIGVLARDKFHMRNSNGSIVSSNFVFGCAYDQQGLLLNSLIKTDGIIGLSRGKISLPSQLANQGNVRNVVAHCLAAEAGGGGYMFLGNDFVPYQQIAWVPMLNIPFITSYHTALTKITYGGKGLSSGGINDEVVLFDSGSSYTYFPKRAYNELVAELEGTFGESLIQDASDNTLPVCWHIKFPVSSVADIRHIVKPLGLHFRSKWWIKSTKLQIPPEGYLVINNKGNVCLGILDGSEVQHGSSLILGDISLRGQLFVYDNVNQKIGWIKSDCSRPKRFERPPFS